MKEGYKHAITLVVVALALAAAYVLYHRYSVTPWTRDGQVRANIVGIAPRVFGPVVQIPIKDNQPVKKGDLLFEIDPSTYQAAVDDASAKVQQAGAQALQAQQNFARQAQLYKRRSSASRTTRTPRTNIIPPTRTWRRPRPNSRPRSSTLGIRKSTLPWMATSRT
jgi:multidrug resistance efflux pump